MLIHIVTPYSAMRALASIGPSAVPALKKAFDQGETYIKIRIIEIFGLMGKAAAGEAAFLKTLLAATKEAVVKDAIEDALEKIGSP